MAGFAPEVLDLLRDLDGGIGGLGHWTKFHIRKPVDGGDDTHDGLSWGKAFATIQTGLDAVGALGQRGKGVVLVGPGGYTEDLQLPLDADAPFGALIAVNPTKRSGGGTWLAAATAVPILRVRARGWLIDGFEFDAPALEGCISLDSLNAGCLASFTEIKNSLFVGGKVGAYGIDFIGAPPLVIIRGNLFYDFHLAGADADCIRCSASPTDQPRFALVEENIFANSDNLVNMNPRGFRESVIKRNNFLATGANYNAAQKLNNVGGAHCHIGPQNMFGGTFTIAGGYDGGASDEWFGNFANIAGGITQADPA